MKSRFFHFLFETGIVVVVLALFGWYISSTYPADTLVVENCVNVQSDATVKVTLSGEVESPGTYSVALGTMLYDVIREAGGVTDKADLSGFDLSLPVVSDTEKFIPEKYEGVSVESSLNNSNSDDSSGDFSFQGDLININTASADELSSLPDIGTKIAERIVDFRNQNGNFAKTEDIKSVKGIGDKIFSKIKNRITVGK